MVITWGKDGECKLGCAYHFGMDIARSCNVSLLVPKIEADRRKTTPKPVEVGLPPTPRPTPIYRLFGIPDVLSLSSLSVHPMTRVGASPCGRAGLALLPPNHLLHAPIIGASSKYSEVRKAMLQRAPTRGRAYAGFPHAPIIVPYLTLYTRSSFTNMPHITQSLPDLARENSLSRPKLVESTQSNLSSSMPYHPHYARSSA